MIHKFMKHTLCFVIVLWAMVETIIALLQYLNICDNGHEVFSMTGTFSNPSQLGCYKVFDKENNSDVDILHN